MNLNTAHIMNTGFVSIAVAYESVSFILPVHGAWLWCSTSSLDPPETLLNPQNQRMSAVNRDYISVGNTSEPTIDFQGTC